MTTEVLLVRVDHARRAGAHPRHLYPPQDLYLIRAGLAERVPELPVIDLWLSEAGLPAAERRVLAQGPRLVVIRALSWCLEEAARLGLALRRRGILTLAIGQQVSHQAHRPSAAWRAAFDLALLGEPEQALPAIIRRLLDGEPVAQLAPAYWQRFEQRRPVRVEQPDRLPEAQVLEEELGAYPFPFPVPGPRVKRWAYLQTAWGCPYRCSHCTEVVRRSVGSELRRRDPKRVVDEIAALLARGVDAIAFEDDTLFCHKGHLLALCAEIEARGLRFRWMANARPDELDEARVSAAARAGAVLLKLGIESGDPAQIERLNKSRHGDQWLAACSAGVARLKRHGIAAVGMFVIGLPGESEAQIGRSEALARRLSPEYLQVQLFTAYPDVALGPEPAPGAIPLANLYHYRPAAPLTGDRLAWLQARFYRRFYFRPGFVLGHLARFWRWYLHPGYLAGRLASLRFLLPGRSG